MSYQLIRLSAGLEMRVDIPGRLILVDSVSTGQGVDIALVRSGTPSPYIPGRQAGFRLVEDFGGVLLRSALDCEVGIFLSINDVQLGGTAGGNVVVPDGVSVVNDLAHSIPVTLTSSSNTTPIPVSLASIRVNNTAAQAIPVNFAGTVSPVLGVVTVDNTNAEAIPVLQKPGEVFEVHVGNTDAQALPVTQKAGATFAVSLPEIKINNTDAQAVPVTQKAGATFAVSLAGESAVRQYLAAAVTNVAPVGVTAAAVAMLAAAPARRSVRVRNVGANAVAIGGAGLAYGSAAVLIQPGETWMESDAPGAAWYCICDAGLASTLNIQTVA
jgi:hypothetical protein